MLGARPTCMRVVATIQMPAMAASKELCSICDKHVYRKQKTIRCGECKQRFDCSCLKVSESELVLYTSSGKSYFKCEGCSKLQRATRKDDTPVRPQGPVPASDASKRVAFPERELLLPDFVCCHSLGVQIETEV